MLMAGMAHHSERVVNVGDCMQRWINNVMQSASHRI